MSVTPRPPWPGTSASERRLGFSAAIILGALLGLGLTGVRLATPPAVAASGSGEAYTALTPTRILDTRTNGSSLGPQQTLNLPIAGSYGVPEGAAAVVLNVTVTDTTSASFLTVYPSGEATPLVSNLNWVAGETRANLVVVAVGADGEVTFYNAGGRTDVVVDLQGFFTAPVQTGAGEYVPLPPSRIADTRTGSGEPYAGDTLGTGQSLNIQVGTMGGVPLEGVAGVVLNVTVTDTTAPSFLSVYPQGEADPGTSTLNWSPGTTVANRVMVPLGTSGEITVYNLAGQADVVVDVDGYFTAGATSVSNASLFYPMGPTRVLDTRSDGGTLAPMDHLSERFAGIAGVSSGASAIVANLTATNTSSAGFFTMSPMPGAPTTSDLNWMPGTTVANLAIPTLNANGDASLYNSQGSADAVIDLFGYFQPVGSSGSDLGAPACTAATLSAPVQSNLSSTLLVSAQSTCPAGVTTYYTFWYRAPGATGWALAQISSTSASYSVDTSGWAAGSYQFLAWASSESGVYQQVSASATTDLVPPPCTGVTASVSPNPGLVSAPVVITATPQCPATDLPYYAFFEAPAGGGAATELGGWTTNPSFLVGTEGWSAGDYSFSVWVSSVGSGPAQAESTVADNLQGSGSFVVANVPYSPQYYGMDCEEAALEMALAHDGITLQGNNIQSQADILGAEGVDSQVPGIGPGYTSGDPMENFIGPPNGGESSTYEPGAYYGAVQKAAVHFGAQVLVAGEGVSPTQLYSYLEAGHPVQAWVTFNFQHYDPTYLTNGVNTWPWVGPHEHSVMVVGIGVNEVLIDNPWPTADYGAAYVGADQWVPMSVFEAAYSSFGDMALVLK